MSASDKSSEEKSQEVSMPRRKLKEEEEELENREEKSQRKLGGNKTDEELENEGKSPRRFVVSEGKYTKSPRSEERSSEKKKATRSPRFIFKQENSEVREYFLHREKSSPRDKNSQKSSPREKKFTKKFRKKIHKKTLHAKNTVHCLLKITPPKQNQTLN